MGLTYYVENHNGSWWLSSDQGHLIDMGMGDIWPEADQITEGDIWTLLRAAIAEVSRGRLPLSWPETVLSRAEMLERIEKRLSPVKEYGVSFVFHEDSFVGDNEPPESVFTKRSRGGRR